MKGTAGIPALQLVTLNKLISQIDKTPSNFFSNMFASVQAPSDAITWEIEYASGGMTPFVAPGSVAPTVGIDGIGQGSAKAAYWKEKMYFDEEFLNNMRQPGTTATYQTAERQLAKGVKKLRYRCERRREWMMAQMFVNGSLNYNMPGGVKFSISYGVPTSHAMAPTGNFKWNTATASTTANIVADVFSARTVVQTDIGKAPDRALINSQMLQVMIIDKGIQTLLAKSAFGNGDLYARPAEVLGSLLGIGLTVYDELYEVVAWVNGTVTGGATTAIPVDDASDFEVGGVMRFYNMTKFNTYEDRVITAVDVNAGTVTVLTAPTATYVAGRDKVMMRKKFIMDNQFLLFTDSVDGQKVAEFVEAPFGIDRHWGFFADTEPEWDPEGLWMRVQDKGLPVLYRPDTTFLITAW